MSNSKTNAFFDSINSIKQGKSVGQLLVIAEQCLDSAIYMAGRGSKQQREIMTDIADAISELRENRKKEWERRENAGSPEIEAPTTSTSADGGKIS